MQVDLQFTEPGGVPGCFAERYSGGYAVLSSHYLIWVDASSLPGRSCRIPLASVTEASLRASHVFAALKLCMHVLCDGQGCPRPGGQQTEQVNLHLCGYKCGKSDVSHSTGLQRDEKWECAPGEGNEQAVLDTLGGRTACCSFSSRMGHPIQADGSTERITSIYGAEHNTDIKIAQEVYDIVSHRDSPGYILSVQTGAGTFSPLQDSLASQSLVEQLICMGFARDSSLRAVAATHNTGIYPTQCNLTPWNWEVTLTWLNGEPRPDCTS